jgi:hypothetical protein
MDGILPIIQTLLGALITSYLVPWLTKKRKREGAALAAQVADDVLQLAVRNNPGKPYLDIAGIVIRELKERLKVGDAAAASIAAGAAARAKLV